MEHSDIFAKLSAQAEDNDQPARLYVGLTQLKNGNFESAAHEMGLLKESDFNDHWADYINGELALTDKDYPAAIKYFSGTIARNPLFYAAYPKLIDALSISGEFVKRDKILRLIKNELPAFPIILIMEMEELFENLKVSAKAEDATAKENNGEKKDKVIDNIIEEIEQGQYEKPESKKEGGKDEFGSVMANIFSNESQDTAKETAHQPKEDMSVSESPSGTQLQTDDLAEPVKTSEKSERETAKPSARKRIVSKTLGEIYASQGQIDEAIAVFEKLLEQKPGNEEIIRKISELKKL